MESHIKRLTDELASALASSDTYRSVEKARDVVQKHEAARIMLEDLQKRQESMRQKEMAGETIREEEWEQLRRLTELASYNPYIRDLIQAEWALAQTMEYIYTTLHKAIGLSVAQPEPPASETKPTPSPAPKSKLWTPPGVR